MTNFRQIAYTIVGVLLYALVASMLSGCAPFQGQVIITAPDGTTCHIYIKGNRPAFVIGTTDYSDCSISFNSKTNTFEFSRMRQREDTGQAALLGAAIEAGVRAAAKGVTP